MADDNVTIWGSGLKFGRKPANGELLIGNGTGAVQTVAPGAVATVNSFDILVFT
jgi:hypothetical protein